MNPNTSRRRLLLGRDPRRRRQGRILSNLVIKKETE